MRREDRRILLFLDNASSHPPDLTLSNIKLCYLPPNTTSHLQPLDQGVIRTFKATYRKYLLRLLLSKMDVADDTLSLCRSITILDAIQWTVKAWSDIKASTIEKCFRVIGFDNSHQQSDDENHEDDGDEELQRGGSEGGADHAQPENEGAAAQQSNFAETFHQAPQ